MSSDEQDAVRLLMLLHVAADSSMAEPAPEGAEACVAGEMRLQAMDFWLRNPDYLAWELLDVAEQRGDSALAAEAARIMSAEEEPDLCTVPMLRWRHGAWERLDDRLSLLAAYGPASDVRRGVSLGGRRDLYLLAEGRRAAIELLVRVPELSWYAWPVLWPATQAVMSLRPGRRRCGSTAIHAGTTASQGYGRRYSNGFRN